MGSPVASFNDLSTVKGAMLHKIGVAVIAIAMTASISPFRTTEEDVKETALPLGLKIHDTSFAPVACFNSERYKIFGRSFSGTDTVTGLPVEGKVCRNLWGGTAIEASAIKRDGSEAKLDLAKRRINNDPKW